MSVTAHKSTPWLTIGRGAAAYRQDEAEAVLAGFAFGTMPLALSSTAAASVDQEFATQLRARAQFKWSYRIYDCVPNSPYAFGVTDLLAGTALDAASGATEYLAMEAILPDLNEVLGHVDVAQTFWALPRAHLGIAPPPEGTPSWWLWRAWALLMGLDNVGVAIAYKTLHHKRPSFFPIFDNVTVVQMGGRRAWQILHEELTSQAAQFTDLEQWFAVEAVKRGGVHLTRLRIHDILLWASISRGGTEREALTRAGQDVLQ